MNTVKIIDILNMSAAEKEQCVQAPLYQLFRKLYKGALYDTPDFCFQKCVDPSAIVFKVIMHFEAQVLSGATVLKIVPTNEMHDGKNVSLLEVTSGYLPSCRGNRYVTQFVLDEMIDYKRKNREKLLCFCDLMTSPVSYSYFFLYPFRIYPRYDEPTPQSIEALFLRLANQMPQYRSLENADPFVKQGAKPRETIEQYYARLTHGLQNSPHIQYYYQKTQSVLGRGLFIIQLIDQSAEEIENIVKNYIMQRGSDKKTFQFKVPAWPHTDFEYLIALRKSHVIRKEVSIQRDNAGKLIFYHADHPIFDVSVPQGIGNVFDEQAAAKCVEMILHGDINVQDKKIIDLGCGYGSAGIAAILMGADKVLFSHINSSYLETLKLNPLINPLEHEFMTHDALSILLQNKSVEQYDLTLGNITDEK